MWCDLQELYKYTSLFTLILCLLVQLCVSYPEASKIALEAYVEHQVQQEIKLIC